MDFFVGGLCFHTICSPSSLLMRAILGNLVSHFLFTFRACQHFEILLDTASCVLLFPPHADRSKITSKPEMLLDIGQLLIVSLAWLKFTLG